MVRIGLHLWYQVHVGVLNTTLYRVCKGIKEFDIGGVSPT